ncbi:hypothetical protein CSA37_12040 [Candidatus Fermentibacteria bacterium]|nr:MAG: hypothetical protein CSA37_12040 [Candidatus Fermentibacteria bacterium]
MPESNGRLVVRLHSLGDVVLASACAAGASAFITRPEYVPVANRFPGEAKTIPLAGGWPELRSISRSYSEIFDLQGNLTTRLGLPDSRTRRFKTNRKLRKRVLSGENVQLPWRAEEYGKVCGLQGDPSPVLIRRSFPEKGSRTIGIVAGGRWKMKFIPDGVVAELARLFCDRMDARVLIMGGAADRERAEAITEQCGYRNVESAAGRGGTGDLIELIESLDLLVSPDSGPAHLAMGLGVPVQVVFTSTSPALGFYPADFKGIYMVKELQCRPCHRHGGTRCSEGNSLCSNRLVPSDMFRRAQWLMQ